LQPVADALARLLDGSPGLALDLVGDTTSAPPSIAERSGVNVLARAGTAERGAWRFQLWTPWLPYAEAVEAIDAVVEGSQARVPTVLAADNAAAARWADPETTVAFDASADEWHHILRWLHDDAEERRALGRRAAERAAAALDPRRVRRVVDELLAWVWS
jgi:hypothetical protein